MPEIMQRFRYMSLGILVVPVLLLAGNSPAAGWIPNSTNHLLSGTWSDACPCKPPCPCWRTRKSNVPACVNLQLYRPDSEQDNSRSASHSAFLLVGTPERSYQAPTSYVLYFDTHTPEATRVSLVFFKRSMESALRL